MTHRKGRRQLEPRGAGSKHSTTTQKRQHETAADAQLDAVSKLRHSADSSSRLEAGRQDSSIVGQLNGLTLIQFFDRARTENIEQPSFSFLHACMQCMH